MSKACSNEESCATKTKVRTMRRVTSILHGRRRRPEPELLATRELGGAPASTHVEETRPAGPLPSFCAPMVVSSGLKPSSSSGMPYCAIFASNVRSRSLCALHTRASSYCRSLIALFFESSTSCEHGVARVPQTSGVLVPTLRVHDARGTNKTRTRSKRLPTEMTVNDKREEQVMG